ncbi:VOC family protein [Pseudooceanicola atlanticus]|uniref:VOC domain-containing protein n=1 Tax=Pseudooceanicola atlanticus TaxID=1461694 RepID=A0A0A0EIE0_9RHOB|nr:VOC family protein [Pseudooceanicola atlanticus]KGM50115.1 hypothetical protein ATO9_00990 [Pseudooceanicola atlanticus]
MTTQPIVVWTEIPVRDIAKACDFYNAVFGWNMTPDHTSGPSPMAIFGSGDMGAVGGNLYEGEPAPAGTGNIVHIAVADLAAATDRAKVAGARIGQGPTEIPPGTFTFIEDPDGNTIGLFQGRAA